MASKKSDLATVEPDNASEKALQLQTERGQGALFTNEQLRNSTFDDLIQSIPAGEIGDSSDLGNGFELLSSEDKTQLVGLDLMFLEWTFRPGDYDRPMVSCLILTKDGRKVIINDGSVGICEQLAEYSTRTGKQSYLRARKGLVRSDYEANDVRPAGTTFYISTSA